MARQFKTPKTKLASTVRQTLGTAIAGTKTAFVGNPITGELKITTGALKGFVWVYLAGGDPGSVFPASNTGNIPLSKGLPVDIQLASNGKWKIVSLSQLADDYLDIDIRPTVEQDQIISGGIIQDGDGSSKVIYIGTSYRNGDIVYQTTSQETADLLAEAALDTSAEPITLPTANGMAKLVLIQIDPTNNTMSYRQSSEYNAGFSLYQAYLSGFKPSPSDGMRKAGYVRLVAGITSITQDNIINEPDIFAYNPAFIPSPGDYSASMVDNDSGVTGATVSDALDTLESAIVGVGGVPATYNGNPLFSDGYQVFYSS